MEVKGKKYLIFIILLFFIFSLVSVVSASDDLNKSFEEKYPSDIDSNNIDFNNISSSDIDSDYIDFNNIGSSDIAKEINHYGNKSAEVNNYDFNEESMKNDSQLYHKDGFSYYENNVSISSNENDALDSLDLIGIGLHKADKSNLASSSYHNVMEENFYNFFNLNNTLNSNVQNGDTLIFQGVFSNKGIIFLDKSVNVIGQNAEFKNTSFHILHSDVSIENLSILNEYDYLDKSGNKDDSWAIYAFESDNLRIIGNNISVKWPKRAYGIYIFDSYNNTIENNTIGVEGEGLSYGIISYETYGSSIRFNNVTVIATSEIYGYEGIASIDDGLSLSEMFRAYAIVMIHSSNNILYGNSAYLSSNIAPYNYTIYNGTNTLFGISIFHGSNDNTLESNKVVIEAYDPFIYGMGVVGTTYDKQTPLSIGNRFINNDILLNGTYFSSGIMVANQAIGTVLNNNTINLYSNNYTYGITLEQSQGSTLINNTIKEYGMSNYGVEFFSSSNNTLISNYITGTGEFAESIGFINSLENNVSGNTLISNGSYSHSSYSIVSLSNSSVFTFYGTFAKWFNSLGQNEHNWIKNWILNENYNDYIKNYNKSKSSGGNKDSVKNVSLLNLSKWIKSLNSTNKDALLNWVKNPNLTELVVKPSPHVQNTVQPDAVALWNTPVWLGPGSNENRFYNNTFVSDNPNPIMRSSNSNRNYFGGNDYLSAKDYGSYSKWKSNASSNNENSINRNSNGNSNINAEDFNNPDNQNNGINNAYYQKGILQDGAMDSGSIGSTGSSSADSGLKASYIESTSSKTVEDYSYVFIILLALIFVLSFLNEMRKEN